MQRLTITHARRWVEHRHRVGWGGVYQGRYKSFVVQDDAHLLTVLRYVERNPVRAGIRRRAEAWPWSSLGQLHQPPAPAVPLVPIAEWPAARRRDWVAWVNRPQTAKEEAALQRSLSHDRPFGSDAWTAGMERKLGLGPLRRRGRPKGTNKSAVGQSVSLCFLNPLDDSGHIGAESRAIAARSACALGDSVNVLCGNRPFSLANRCSSMGHLVLGSGARFVTGVTLADSPAQNPFRRQRIQPDVKPTTGRAESLNAELCMHC